VNEISRPAPPLSTEALLILLETLTMRLTLRTLLAYLDDTMDPAEIKEFGKRVAESDAAQELIARIRQITRRRRLTAPPTTGPGSFDPNTVAEYLDNELPNEQVAELEKTCLESDLHLAEIAAAHQILTLVLGQPALVPPTARERMYGLVQGREAIPFRRASTRSADGAVLDDHEDGPPGAPFGKSPPWVRWAIPAAGLFLLIGIGFAVMRYLPSQPPPRNRPVADNNKTDKDNLRAQVDNGAPEKNHPEKDSKPSKDNPPEKEPKPNKDNPSEKDLKPNKGTNPDKVIPDPPVQPNKRPEPPSTDRVDVGVYEVIPNTPSIMVQHRTDGWKRLTANNAVVFTNDPLVSLPGFRSMVRLNSGVKLTLSGNTPEFSQDPIMDLLLDSAVILHKNPGFDADLTVLRGRVYITASNPGLKVRLRFSGEIWDLTLNQPNTEVGLDLMRQVTRDSNWRAAEEPKALAFLCVLQGKANLKIDKYFDHVLEAPPGPAIYTWDNEGERMKEPLRLDKVPPIWSQNLPVSAWKAELKSLDEQLAKLSAEKGRELQAYRTYQLGRLKGGEAMQSALDLLSKGMMDNSKSVNIALKEGSELSRDLGLRLLCIYSMSAIDDLGKLVDILASEAPASAPDRDGAIFALRRWLSRGPRQGDQLYNDDGKTKTGVLLNGGRYTPKEADLILTLLHDFSNEDSRRKETFELLVHYLSNDKLAIRELARWHLLRLSQGVPKLPAFDAAWTFEQRNLAVADWQKLLESNSLPPRPPEPPPMPPK
jgi:hypothetical protein